MSSRPRGLGLCLTLALLLASVTDAGAKIRRVQRLQIVPGDEPPVYRLEQVQEETDPASRDVVYDLRIYATRRVDTEGTVPGSIETIDVSLIFGAGLLHEFRNIAATRFVPSVALDPCKSSMWTVRAHFTVDGRRHVTNWSGDYDEKDIENYCANLISDSVGARGLRAVAGYVGYDQREMCCEQSYYFPFRVTGPNQECAAGD